MTYLGILKKKKYTGLRYLIRKLRKKKTYYWVIFRGGDSNSFYKVAKSNKGVEYNIDDYFNNKMVGYTILNGEAYINNFYPNLDETKQKPLQ
jgi:hypothetical protein